ncbi:MAG: hypothetical protein RID91_16860 [Azospirillaceae bacterium]
MTARRALATLAAALVVALLTLADPGPGQAGPASMIGAEGPAPAATTHAIPDIRAQAGDGSPTTDVATAAALLADLAAPEDQGVAPALSPWPDSGVETAQLCCRICRKGKACGDSCINRQLQCHQPPGCACNG